MIFKDQSQHHNVKKTLHIFPSHPTEGSVGQKLFIVVIYYSKRATITVNEATIREVMQTSNPKFVGLMTGFSRLDNHKEYLQLLQYSNSFFYGL